MARAVRGSDDCLPDVDEPEDATSVDELPERVTVSETATLLGCHAEPMWERDEVDRRGGTNQPQQSTGRSWWRRLMGRLERGGDGRDDSRTQEPERQGDHPASPSRVCCSRRRASSAASHDLESNVCGPE
jgi:hypothetical protein